MTETIHFLSYGRYIYILCILEPEFYVAAISIRLMFSLSLSLYFSLSSSADIVIGYPYYCVFAITVVIGSP
jgi:hypothetical protein